jgi:hypothetical protein
MDDTVEAGVELLAKLEREVTVAEAVDRIEMLTSNPSTTRAILEEAARRGVVERDGGTVTPTTTAHVEFESEVVQKEGEFTCRRCGADVGTGHFVRLDNAEIGPFGSSCVRTVTGRD